MSYAKPYLENCEAMKKGNAGKQAIVGSLVSMPKEMLFRDWVTVMMLLVSYYATISDIYHSVNKLRNSYEN